MRRPAYTSAALAATPRGQFGGVVCHCGFCEGLGLFDAQCCVRISVPAPLIGSRFSYVNRLFSIDR